MSSGNKFRMHMGCGEPLRSRWWVAQPLSGLSPEDREGRGERLRKRRGVRRQGVKCKT